jgi:hypothetical protein
MMRILHKQRPFCHLYCRAGKLADSPAMMRTRGLLATNSLRSARLKGLRGTRLDYSGRHLRCFRIVYGRAHSLTPLTSCRMRRESYAKPETTTTAATSGDPNPLARQSRRLSLAPRSPQGLQILATVFAPTRLRTLEFLCYICAPDS